MPDMPEEKPVDPKTPPWVAPTFRLSTEDVTQLLGEAVPDMDATVTVTAKVVGVEKGQRTDYETNEKKPRHELQLEIQSITPTGGEMEDEEMEMEDEEQALALLKSSPDQIDQDVLAALMSNAQQQEVNGNTEAANRMQNLYRQALRLSMKQKLS